jgi:GNAT superfamily N-acetyltransferase
MKDIPHHQEKDMIHEFPPLEIAKLVELGEAEAYADMFEAAPAALGMRVERVSGTVALIAPSVPIFLFNRVIGLGLEETVSDVLLEQIASLYVGSPVHGVQLTPITRLEPDRLEQFGFRAAGRWAKMYRPSDTEVDVPTNLEIVQIGPERAAEFSQVTIAAHGMPPAIASWTATLVGRPSWHAYAALEANEIVSVGMMFVRGDVAWLGLGGTLPSHRRRGAQGAIMARRIREAAALGCTWVITETGEDLPEKPNPSFHNMIRTGFRLAYQRQNYIF